MTKRQEPEVEEQTEAVDDKPAEWEDPDLLPASEQADLQRLHANPPPQ